MCPLVYGVLGKNPYLEFSSLIPTFIFFICLCRFQQLQINLECKILELMLVILMMMKAVVWLVMTLGMQLVFFLSLSEEES